VEAVFGRVRDEVWGPRTLDLDIIVYGDVVSDDPELTLPHPRAHERAFVLAPWLDIDPDAEVPGWGRVSDLLAKVDHADVRRLDDAVLHSPG
jgi:2-amino-4-hydroxy-6-hydroxymethyldihydropteridine diphosphokinase